MWPGGFRKYPTEGAGLMWELGNKANFNRCKECGEIVSSLKKTA